MHLESKRNSNKKCSKDRNKSEVEPEMVQPHQRLVQNLQKLSKRLHREDHRRIRSKQKILRRKQAKELNLPKQIPKTIESTRKPNDDSVHPSDEETKIEESLDEFSNYFDKKIVPKILITTSHNPHRKTVKFCRELRNTITNSELRWRRKAHIKKIIPSAIERNFTDLLIINEDRGQPNGLLHVHLPNGPTANYRLSSIKYQSDIKNKAAFNNSCPEVIINNMTTRLGYSIGRMLSSLFHFEPQFRGRKVITFHNQRDYIFFRQHLYEFKNESKVAIKELGPRFTLKLRSLQHGTFDSKFGEYEWIEHRHEQGVDRRKFAL
ncbi:hypothetical protein NH340_JMT01675 [Sarcoptes scabiei]|nr:hypothetical protein NH340_JMT01675 [Sarcoptes scabiei]